MSHVIGAAPLHLCLSMASSYEEFCKFFVGSPKQYYSKPRHTASLGYDSNFKWGSLINCNETTKVNALYNCNWNVEIMADTKRVAGNMEDSSLEAKAKVSGDCIPSSKWAWLDIYERTRVGVCCTACCCVRKPRADIQFPFSKFQ